MTEPAQLRPLSQPMEWTDTALLRSTLTAIDAENTLLWSSDWPRWDFDLPSKIIKIPLLSEQAKRNILGGNARKVFGEEKLS
jgi:predicted TIM-barrel fold metal-dependent hydrolase